MSLALIALLASVGLFFGMLACMELGRRVGLTGLKFEPDTAKGLGAVEGAVFGLLGLLIAFTFSGAATRFEARRHLIGQEANAIGTAYLRISLLPEKAQPEMRDLFRRYLDLRIKAYRNTENRTETDTRLADATVVQNAIWARAVFACKSPDAPASASILMLPALNDMIDITTTRVMATRNHPPRIIFFLLGGLSLFSALLAGFGMACRGRSWLHVAAFAAIISLTVYVILDLEYPRQGLIRVDTADRVLVELRQSMK